MNDTIPSAEQVRAALAPLTLKQVDALAALSGVPAPTIYKIRIGQTENPGIDTVGKFMRHIETVRSAPAETGQEAA
jgi:predicted transcriptional regulator